MPRGGFSARRDDGGRAKRINDNYYNAYKQDSKKQVNAGILTDAQRRKNGL